MSYPAFSPPKSPSPNGTKLTNTPRLRVVRFGDGYAQRAPDGINYFPHKSTLQWDTLSDADAQTIDTFFTGLAGGVFSYQFPGDSFGARKWTVTTWTRIGLGAGYEQVTAELQEEFDP